MRIAYPPYSMVRFPSGAPSAVPAGISGTRGKPSVKCEAFLTDRQYARDEPSATET
jgi:hypothetical protein